MKSGHLWAVGYENMERAEQVRAEVGRLSERRCLTPLDTAVAVRYPDGSLTPDGSKARQLRTASRGGSAS
jgi:hypothetical protein